MERFIGERGLCKYLEMKSCCRRIFRIEWACYTLFSDVVVQNCFLMHRTIQDSLLFLKSIFHGDVKTQEMLVSRGVDGLLPEDMLDSIRLTITV